MRSNNGINGTDTVNRALLRRVITIVRKKYDKERGAGALSATKSGTQAGQGDARRLPD